MIDFTSVMRGLFEFSEFQSLLHPLLSNCHYIFVFNQACQTRGSVVSILGFQLIISIISPDKIKPNDLAHFQQGRICRSFSVFCKFRNCRNRASSTIRDYYVRMILTVLKIARTFRRLFTNCTGRSCDFFIYSTFNKITNCKRMM